jgi:hypothetical protein
MNTFNKIVASPFIAAGWVAGQVRNGYDAATKASEPVVAKATKAAKAAKAKATKAGVAVKNSAAKAANATGRAAAKAKDAAVAATTRVTAFCRKVQQNVWAGITGSWGAQAAVFFSIFAGIEYIFAYVYFLFAIGGLVFGMAPALATAFATSGVVLFGVAVTADLISLWLQSVNDGEFTDVLDPFFGGRRLLALN